MSMDVYLKKLEDELRLRKYSPKTIQGYTNCVAKYLRAKGRDFEKVDIDFIKASGTHLRRICWKMGLM